MGRMAQGNFVKRTFKFKRIVTGYKSLPAGHRGARDRRDGLRLVHHRQSVLPEPPRPGIRDGRDDLLKHGSAALAHAVLLVTIY